MISIFSGTGRIFSLVSSTTALLVEGRSISLCVELVQSTSQPDTRQPLRIIQVFSRTDLQHNNGKLHSPGNNITITNS